MSDIKLPVLKHVVTGIDIQHNPPLDAPDLRRAVEVLRVGIQDEAVTAAILRQLERSRPDRLLERRHAVLDDREGPGREELRDLRDRLQGLGVEVGGGSPQEFAAYIAREIPKWTKVVKDSGARVE